MAEQTFDPRFDPAFQRGYVPPSEPAVVAPTVTYRESELIGEPPIGEPQSPTAVVAGTEEPVVQRQVNPYIVTLWLIAVLFTLGGAALLLTSYAMMFTSYTGGPSRAAAAQAVYIFGSVFGVPVITVGLGTVAGLIFLSAWRSWYRSEGSKP